MLKNFYNKTQKIKVLTMALLLSLMSVSCNDWLHLEPQNAITVKDYWQSKEEVHSAAMGIYSSMLTDHPWLWLRWGEVRAEMVTSTNYWDYTYVNNGDILPTLALVEWAPLYRTINFCNNFIEKAPSVLDLDESFTPDMLNAYLSEAYAIRALMYFYLVRFYGDVPLITEATLSDDQELRVPKSSMGEVLAQIEQDLIKAEQTAVENYDDIENDKGRITKAAINTMQADLYLWTNEYDKSITAADKVINSGKFGLVPFGEEWLTTLFHQTNSIEGIFELQYSDQYLNPFNSALNLNPVFTANADIIENFFPIDIYLDPDSADIRGDRGSYRSSRQYKLWKYIGVNRSLAKTEEQYTSNFMVYRYADVLLLKAEALAMRANEGDLNESLRLINVIRNRAKAAKETQEISDNETPTTHGLITYIVNERAREFAFEGKRWPDILRNARRNNYERMDLIRSMVLLASPSNRTQTILSKYQDTLSHYFPIPQVDIDAGYPILEQNTFYRN
nr:RagB/SusD family nutrient uptake outer membrane protein [uncultured Carboxylicivirga sp.]